MPYRRGIEDGTNPDDTQGNMPLRKSVEDGVDTDDTEGNMPYRKVEDGVEDDDTEGNLAKSGRTIPPSVNPGKVARPGR
jgi:hypothetical protein